MLHFGFSIAVKLIRNLNIEWVVLPFGYNVAVDPYDAIANAIYFLG